MNKSPGYDFQGTLNIQVPTFFRSYFFDIYDPCTSFFYKVTPWQQLFYACGLIFIVRHIQQQGVEIMIDVQVIGFRCFYETQYNGTCRCSISSIMKQKVFTPRYIGFCPTFRYIIRDLASSIQQIIHKSLFMIKGIVYRFFKLTPASRLQGFQPCPEFIPDGRFCFLAFSVFVLPVEVLCRDVPYRKDGYRMQLLFRQGAGNCLLQFPAEVLQVPVQN